MANTSPCQGTGLTEGSLAGLAAAREGGRAGGLGRLLVDSCWTPTQCLQGMCCPRPGGKRAELCYSDLATHL